MPTIRVIQPIVQRNFGGVACNSKLRRVAGYARVSTDSDEQLTSFEAQVEYYTRKIQENPEWTFVKVFTDVDTFYGLIPKSPSTADFSVVHGLLFGLFGYRVLN